MEDFEIRFREAVRTRRVSRELEPLLRTAYDALGDPARLKTALEALMAYLAEAGRTDANCCATDYFFSAIENDDERIERLPPPLRDVVLSIGGALHDAVYAPHIASNFDSLPEQLLERVRDVKLP